MRLLLERGADPDLRDAAGHDAVEYHREQLAYRRQSVYTSVDQEQITALEALIGVLEAR